MAIGDQANISGADINRIATNGGLIAQQLGNLINTLTGLLPFSGAFGTCTLSAAVSTVVNDSAVKATSRVFLFSANAAAGTLVGSAKSPYAAPADFVVGTSFTVKTASGAAAAGGEVYFYLIANPSA